ncbi:MAG: hypothetical protein RLZ10_1378 [Bacteroidota bacterium]|jgi:hypothetical protein
MNFKFFQKEENTFLRLEPIQQLTLTRPSFTPENVDFCFQFGDNEPIVFATGPNICTINLSPQSNSNVIFNDNGNTFKLFARERI